MGIYKKCGFEVVEALRLGKGKVGKDGLKLDMGGRVRVGEELEGITIWAMVWWPAGTKPAGKGK